jgi:site-specific DNA-cytosine methylase
VIAGETLPTNGNFAVADPRAMSSREGSGYLGVNEWNNPTGTVTGNGRPGAGAFTVADPRADNWRDATLGVVQYDTPCGTITGSAEATTGKFSVADPRTEHWSSNQLGVNEWDQAAPTITSQRSPMQGRFSVADPRIDGHDRSVQMGVRDWTQPSATVTGNMWPGAGPNSVADPRAGENGPRFNNVYRVVAYDQPSPAVTGQGGNSRGAVADPRGGANQHVNGKYRITPYDSPANTVIAGSTTGQGAFALADPRTGYGERSHQNKLAMVGWEDTARTITGAIQVQGGALSVTDPRPACLNKGYRGKDPTKGPMYVDHYGVVSWTETSKTVPGSACLDNGRWTVADPRFFEPSPVFVLPKPEDRLVAVIIALDGTWHRPFTTLELAALQDLVDPEDLSPFFGNSDQRHREAVGNAVPPGAAEAVGYVIGQALLLAWAGETFRLSDTPIWVRNHAIAIAVDQPTLVHHLH